MSDSAQQLQLPIIYDINRDTPRGYANHLVVQNHEHEYVLYFFDVQVPFFSGDPGEKEMQINDENFSKANAHCIAKITVAKGRMEEFMDVLQRYYEEPQNDME
jgi:hypothetical protein